MGNKPGHGRFGNIRKLRSGLYQVRYPGDGVRPPKSQAGVRTVSLPRAVVPAMREHLDTYTGRGSDALVFTGAKGRPLRRGNFRRASGWKDAVAALGVPELHFHDLRHTGNTLAAQSGASLRELMSRMGHDSSKAALIYQHRSNEADRAIADALSARVEGERHESGESSRHDSDDDDGDDGAAGALVPAG